MARDITAGYSQFEAEREVDVVSAGGACCVRRAQVADLDAEEQRLRRSPQDVSGTRFVASTLRSIANVGCVDAATSAGDQGGVCLPVELHPAAGVAKWHAERRPRHGHAEILFDAPTAKASQYPPAIGLTPQFEAVMQA